QFVAQDCEQDCEFVSREQDWVVNGLPECYLYYRQRPRLSTHQPLTTHPLLNLIHTLLTSGDDRGVWEQRLPEERIYVVSVPRGSTGDFIFARACRQHFQPYLNEESFDSDQDDE